MVPPPPDLFSTTVETPHAVARCAASRRPITSVVPPGAAGMMRRTVSVGFQSDKAGPGRAVAARPATTARRETRSVMRCFPELLFEAQSSRGARAQARADERSQGSGRAKL